MCLFSYSYYECTRISFFFGALRVDCFFFAFLPVEGIERGAKQFSEMAVCRPAIYKIRMKLPNHWRLFVKLRHVLPVPLGSSIILYILFFFNFLFRRFVWQRANGRNNTTKSGLNHPFAGKWLRMTCAENFVHSTVPERRADFADSDTAFLTLSVVIIVLFINQNLIPNSLNFSCSIYK